MCIKQKCDGETPQRYAWYSSETACVSAKAKLEKANTKRKLIQEDYFFDFNKVTIDFFFKGLQFIKSDFLQN